MHGTYPRTVCGMICLMAQDDAAGHAKVTGGQESTAPDVGTVRASLLPPSYRQRRLPQIWSNTLMNRIQALSLCLALGLASTSGVALAQVATDQFQVLITIEST